MSAKAAKQIERAPKVVVREDTDDPEWVAGRCHAFLAQLPKPQRVTVTLPATARGACDHIVVTIREGELTRDNIHLSGEVASGTPEKKGDGFEFAGCIRPDQIERLILALQLAVAEADKLGLRTPRPIPKVRLA